MTQTAAIAQALLEGQVLSIMTGFKLFSCTNLPRELSRGIEQKFNIIISKERVDFTSKYGQSGFYFRYRLNQTDYNKEGIEKMKEYVAANGGEVLPKKTRPVERPTTYKTNTSNLKEQPRLFN